MVVVLVEGEERRYMREGWLLVGGRSREIYQRGWGAIDHQTLVLFADC